MKWNFVLTTTTLVILSINAYAAEPAQAKLISHKEWTTGNAKGFFKAGSTSQLPAKKSILMKLLKHVEPVADFMSVKDTIFRNGLPNYNDDTATTYGHAEVFISNDGDEPHQYTISTSLCAMGLYTGLDPVCLDEEDTYQIPPSGTWMITKNPVMTYPVTSGEVYSRFVQTFIRKDNDTIAVSSYDDTTN